MNHYTVFVYIYLVIRPFSGITTRGERRTISMSRSYNDEGIIFVINIYQASPLRQHKEIKIKFTKNIILLLYAQNKLLLLNW